MVIAFLALLGWVILDTLAELFARKNVGAAFAAIMIALGPLLPLLRGIGLRALQQISAGGREGLSLVRLANLLGIPLALFIFFMRQFFVLPPDWTTLGLFLFSIFLTAALQFFMSYTMAMLAFWVLEVSTFIFILFAFEYIASGHMFPLDILPPTLAKALSFTPFPYQMYFPVSIYMGKATGGVLLQGFLMQIGWVIAAYCLARFAWHRGIKKYSAVGG